MTVDEAPRSKRAWILICGLILVNTLNYGLRFYIDLPVWRHRRRAAYHRSRLTMVPNGGTLDPMRAYPTVIVIVSTLAALAMNVVLDTYTDMQMLLRLVIAVLFGLLITVCLNRWFIRRRSQDAHNQSPRTR